MAGNRLLFWRCVCGATDELVAWHRTAGSVAYLQQLPIRNESRDADDGLLLDDPRPLLLTQGGSGRSVSADRSSQRLPPGRSQRKNSLTTSAATSAKPGIVGADAKVKPLRTRLLLGARFVLLLGFDVVRLLLVANVCMDLFFLCVWTGTATSDGTETAGTGGARGAQDVDDHLFFQQQQ